MVLTGIGEDGVAGLRKLRETGGRIVAQDEKSSVAFSMSSTVIAAGLADWVLPLENISAHLGEIV